MAIGELVCFVYSWLTYFYKRYDKFNFFKM